MNTATVASPVLERVKKLLALSQSDNQNERNNALAKANALIAEHNIDVALIESTDTAAPEPFEQEELVFGKRKPVEARFISWLLEKHFRVKVVYSNKYDPVKGWNKTILFLGRKSDAELARWLAGFLREEFARRWTYHRNSTKAPLQEKNTFYYGCYQGLNDRLTEETRKVEEIKFAQVASARAEAAAINSCDGEQNLSAAPTADALRNKYAVALRTESESLKNELRRRFPRLGHARSSSLNIRHGSSSLDAGRAHGRTISTSRPLSA